MDDEWHQDAIVFSLPFHEHSAILGGSLLDYLVRGGVPLNSILKKGFIIFIFVIFKRFGTISYMYIFFYYKRHYKLAAAARITPRGPNHFLTVLLVLPYRNIFHYSVAPFDHTVIGCSIISYFNK